MAKKSNLLTTTSILMLVPDMWPVILQHAISVPSTGEDQYVGRLLSMVNRELHALMEEPLKRTSNIQWPTVFAAARLKHCWLFWVAAHRTTLRSDDDDASDYLKYGNYGKHEIIMGLPSVHFQPLRL